MACGSCRPLGDTLTPLWRSAAAAAGHSEAFDVGDATQLMVNWPQVVVLAQVVLAQVVLAYVVSA